PDLPVERRHTHYVIGTVHEPGDDAAEPDSVDLRHAAVEAERGDGADVGMDIVAAGAAPQRRDDIVRQSLRLADRMLRTRTAHRAWLVGFGQIRDGGAVTGREDVVDIAHGEIGVTRQ